MAEYDNTNKGVLFTNTRKEEGSSHPDYTGNIDVNGEKFDLAGWINISGKGTKYVSLVVNEPYRKKDESEAPF